METRHIHEISSTSTTAIIDAKDVLDDSELPPRLLFSEKDNEDDFDLQSPVAGILGLGPTTIEHPGFVCPCMGEANYKSLWWIKYSLCPVEDCQMSKQQIVSLS